MKNLKNILKTIGLIITLSLSIGCSEEFFEEEAFSFTVQDQFYQTIGDANAAVAALYRTAFIGPESRGMTERTLFAVMENPSPAVTDRQGVNGSRQQFDHWGYDPSINELRIVYQEIYEKINRACNVANNIADMENPKVSAEGVNEIRRLEGEARFLRAWMYFWAVRMWGDIPLRVEEAGDPNELQLSKSPASEVYDFIIEDLEYAVENLPDANLYNSSNNLRASKGAAQTLLAKVYLTRATTDFGSPNDNQTALEYCNNIIEGGVHNLAENVTDWIYWENGPSAEDPATSNYEVMFQASFANTQPNGSRLRPIMPQNYVNGGWGNFQHEAPYIELFDTMDTRLEGYHILGYELNNNNGFVTIDPLTFEKPENENGQQYRLNTPSTKKHIDPNAESNLGNSNVVLLRYADVLLMKAEALNEINNGPNAEAYEAINTIRRRAYGVDLNSTSEFDVQSGLAYTDFKRTLYIERLKELSMELHGWFDLVRMWDVAAPIAAEHSTRTYEFSNAVPKAEIVPSDKYKVFPIPSNAIERNPLLTQHSLWE